MRTFATLVAVALFQLAGETVHAQPSTGPVCRINSAGAIRGRGADICAQVQRAWQTYLGLPVAPGGIDVEDIVGFRLSQLDDEWHVAFPLATGRYDRDALRPNDGIVHYFARSVIPHEAGHIALRAAFPELTHTGTGAEYGTILPDWLDEAIAIAMEARDIREGRLRSVGSVTPSLARLATMQHPNLVERVPIQALHGFTRSQRVVVPPCTQCFWRPDSLKGMYEITDTGVNAAGRPDTIVWYWPTDPLLDNSTEGRMFYPLSYALLRFIHHGGGPAAVRELIRRYSRTPKTEIAPLAGLPGLPRSIAEFETAWLQFLKRLPPEPN
jgi:hypothetical protein